MTPITIRPHPSEPINDWISATKNFEIFHFNKGPLSKIFQDSILMMHNRSTWNSLYFGLPVISFEPIELMNLLILLKNHNFSNYVATQKGSYKKYR